MILFKINKPLKTINKSYDCIYSDKLIFEDQLKLNYIEVELDLSLMSLNDKNEIFYKGQEIYIDNNKIKDKIIKNIKKDF